MSQLVFADWLQIVSFAGIVVALVANIAALLRRREEREKADEGKNIEMMAAARQTVTQLQSIERKLDGVASRLDSIAERLVAAEESAKSAHRRIDEIRKVG